jgi:O-antigen/teichoic acid export membrane protein
LDTLTRDTARSYLWNSVAVALDGASLLVVSALVGRLAGRDALGILGWVISAAGLLTLAAGLGFKEGVAVLAQRASGDQAALRGLFARFLKLRLAAAVLAAGAMVLLAAKDLSPWVLAGAAAYVFALLVSTLFSSFNIALFQARAVAAGRLASAVVGIVLAGAAALRGSLAGVFWGLAGGSLAAGVVFFLPLRSLARGERRSDVLKPSLELPLTMWLAGIATFLIGSHAAPAIMRKLAFVDNAEIAVFNVGLGVALISNRAFMGGFASVVLAAFSRADAESPDSLARLHSLYVRASAVMSLPLLFAAAAFAPVLCRIWLKGDVTAAAAVTRILAAWLIADRLFGGGAHSTALYSAGLHRVALLVRAVFAVASVAAVWAAAVAGGARGAAFASGGVGFAVVACEWLVLRRSKGIGLPWPTLSALAAGCAAAALPAWVLVERGTTASAIVAAAVFVAITVVALLLVRPLRSGEAASIAGRGPARRFLLLLEAGVSNGS